MGERSVRRQRNRPDAGASQPYGSRSVCACFARSRGITALRVSPVGYRVAEGGALCNGRRQAHFKQRRAFRRYCGAFVLGSPQPLSRIVFQETEKGRPYLRDLPNVRFSFSSCRFGFSAHGRLHTLSVLTSKIKPGTWRRRRLAQQFFSQAEVKAVKAVGGLARLRTFCQLWSLKEAALKSIGEGLPFGLDAFEFELVPTLRVVHAPPEYGGPERFDAQTIQGTNICAALVIRSVA